MDLFDLHCDTLTVCSGSGKELRENDLHISLSRMPAGSCWGQTFAIFVPDDLRGEAAVEFYHKNVAFFREQMAKNADRILPASTFTEIEAAFAAGKFAAILSVEGGAALGGEIDRIDELRADGVRMLTLTWNGENELGSGSDTKKGLTDFGRAAVRRMEDAGILVDVSHLNDQGFADLTRIARKPFIATHSNSRAVCDHPRNLTDEQFCTIRDMGGLVGINYYRFFIREDGTSADITDLIAHIDHFLALGGEDILCCGSDFDGAEIPPYLNSIDKVANLHAALLAHGIDEEVIQKILFENVHRFFNKYL